MDRHAGFLPVIAAGTLLVLYLTWGAMHDIAHGESDCTTEYAVLALSAPVFFALCRLALRVLTPRERIGWLAGTGLAILLFDLGALQAALRPKYAMDSALGGLFLVAGVPLVLWIACRLIREARA